jgi:hypothetical protein
VARLGDRGLPLAAIFRVAVFVFFRVGRDTENEGRWLSPLLVSRLLAKPDPHTPYASPLFMLQAEAVNVESEIEMQN